MKDYINDNYNFTLKEDGFTVIKNVLDYEKCNYYKQIILNNPEEQHGHSKTMWEIRLDTVNVFESIWNTNDLITGFDGVGVRKKGECWNLEWHVDQTKKTDDCICVQGILSLGNIDETTGGTCLLRKSHKMHEEWITRQFSEDEWQYQSMEQYVTDNLEVIQPKLGFGDVLVWDSRTTHKVREPTDDTSTRIVAYLSMVPSYFASDYTIEKRFNAAKKGIVSTHWPQYFVDRNSRQASIEQDVFDENILSLIVGKRNVCKYI